MRKHKNGQFYHGSPLPVCLWIALIRLRIPNSRGDHAAIPNWGIHIYYNNFCIDQYTEHETIT